MTIRRVLAQISETQVAEGFYTVKGNVLTMVWWPDGEPIEIDDAPVTAKISSKSNPDTIARILTKRIRKSLRGERVEGFDRVIDYSRDGSIV